MDCVGFLHCVPTHLLLFLLLPLPLATIGHYSFACSTFCFMMKIWLYGNFRYRYHRKLSGLYRRERLYASAISRNSKEEDE